MASKQFYLATGGLFCNASLVKKHFSSRRHYHSFSVESDPLFINKICHLPMLVIKWISPNASIDVEKQNKCK
ncbi:hypothetical protein T4B_14476 [Trichinella pseudospiralis]|uniref:Uncharacterized protein n=2 Tax=Trichinella pseudospiralis TaxID=6337 RepID=A0A0V1J6L9_TRIPS|nr:hypothetical protein T4E_1323 [Trichinella pseudospiralis]KRY77613.1 hypothetical protein T4A_6248 [Trichinella pseudospiralis]KRY87983.1 hypothetical protein T4D_3365 [Trichinella pseudospiralis]KRZ30609.1 hypothetical protein T4B_14476 [Trichinella pseudospiralis]KRZ43701.1 hypothetical protein T4C_310 [Trichinella pseudospiralis]